jgi:hypothetical protein
MLLFYNRIVDGSSFYQHWLIGIVTGWMAEGL